MKTRSLPTILVLLLSGLLLVSCSQDDSFMSLVPANTMAVVRINQGEQLLKNLDETLAASPFATQLGGMSLSSVLGFALAQSKITLSDFDLTKPLGAAVLPPEGDGTEPGVALYLPAKKPDELKPKLATLAGESIPVFVARNYVVLSIGAPSLVEPPKSSLAIRGNLSYDPNEILVYVPAKELLASHQAEWQAFKAAELSDSSMMDALSDLPATGFDAAALEKFMKGFQDLMVQTVESADNLVAYVRIDKSALGFRTQFNLLPDSPAAKAVKGISGSSLQASDFNSLPDASLLSLGMAIKPESIKGITTAVLDAILPILGLDAAENAAYKAMMEESFGLYGEKSVASFDYQLNFEELKKLESGESTLDQASLAKAFSFAFLMRSDITSAEAVRAYMEKSFANPVMQSIIDKSFASTGLTGSFKLEQAKLGDKDYQTIAYQVSRVEGAADSALDDTSAELMIGLLNSLKIACLAEGKQLYLAMPDKDQGASLQAFMEGKLTGPALGSNKAFADFLKNLPSGSQIVYRLNVAPILAMAQSLPADSQPDRLGLSGYLKLTDSGLESGCTMGMTEIFDIANLAMQAGLGGFF